MAPRIPKDPKEFLETVTFQYRQFIERLQNKLASGKLTEEQKIKVFFYIKNEEVKNMHRADLLRSKKKYQQTLVAIDRTIGFLQERQTRRWLLLQPERIKRRIALEKVAKRHCSRLLMAIDKELTKH